MARLFAVPFLVMLLATGTAFADDGGSIHPWMDDTFSVEVGIFFPERLARFKAAGSLEAGIPEIPTLDFGSQLSVSQSDETFAAEFGWRMGERWTMRMQYFDSTGSGTAILEEDVEWEDLVFLEGTSATAGTQFQLTRAVWDYMILNKPNSRLGLSVGFHWLYIRGFIEGTVLEQGGATTAGESASVDAPLPNIGFTYAHALSSRWGFRTRLDWFSADIHPYDGIFINASAGFFYRMTERFGAGFNYNFVQLDVGVDGDNWRGEVETRYDGLYVYLAAVW